MAQTAEGTGYSELHYSTVVSPVHSEGLSRHSPLPLRSLYLPGRRAANGTTQQLLSCTTEEDKHEQQVKNRGREE